MAYIQVDNCQERVVLFYALVCPDAGAKKRPSQYDGLFFRFIDCTTIRLRVFAILL